MALKGLESFSMPLDKISRCSATIIRHLAKEFPSERLGNGRNGVNDIRRHKWFQVCRMRDRRAPSLNYYHFVDNKCLGI